MNIRDDDVVSAVALVVENEATVELPDGTAAPIEPIDGDASAAFDPPDDPLGVEDPPDDDDDALALDDDA
jgi:hypothetical protein